jgi:DNA polymerase V
MLTGECEKASKTRNTAISAVFCSKHSIPHASSGEALQPLPDGATRVDSQASPVLLPFLFDSVAAGFPSPASDYIEDKIDAGKLIAPNPVSTYFIRVEGDSMTGAGIDSGDMLVVDTSIEPRNGSIVLAAINGENTVKRLIKSKSGCVLRPENPRYSPIPFPQSDSDRIFGTVMWILKRATPCL